MRDSVVVVEPDSSQGRSGMRISCAVSRKLAHENGIPHATVLVAVVVAQRHGDGQLVPHILLQRRPDSKMISPDKWDICGGHIEATPDVLANAENSCSPAYLERLSDETAIREVNEECKVRLRSGGFLTFRHGHLRRFGCVAEFTHGLEDRAAPNREYSTLYVAFVPLDLVILGPGDDLRGVVEFWESIPIGGGSVAVALDSKLLTWAELIEDFASNYGQYADGVARLLSRALREPATIQGLDKLLRREIGLG